MTYYRSLNHSKWACQYHVVFIPKYRKKAIYGELRRYVGEVLRRLARQRESEVEEGHLLADHVHMLVSIPPKYSVAQVIGYIAREFAGRSRSFVGQHFWARGYFVSTVGRDERAIRAYIRTHGTRKYPPAKPGALVVSRSKRPDVAATRPLGPPYGWLCSSNRSCSCRRSSSSYARDP